MKKNEMWIPIFPGAMVGLKKVDDKKLTELQKKAKKYLDDALYYDNKEKEDHIVDSLCNSIKPIKDQIDKCDIIDIARKEMKHLNIEKTDEEYVSIMIQELVDKMIYQWRKNRKKLTYDEDKFLTTNLNIQNIIYKERYIMFRRWSTSHQKEFALKMGLPEDTFIIIPEINGVSEKVVILLDKFEEPTTEAVYDEERLIEKLKELGLNESVSEKQFESYIDYLIQTGFKQNSDIIDDDTYIRCNIEDKVVAIGINKTIDNPKETVAKILKINPDLFIEVCGPGSTVLLIDTRRWVLEEKESCEEDIWYQ